MWKSEYRSSLLNEKISGENKEEMKKSTNVYGRELQSCSEPGMAMTGFTRNGFCSHHDGDNGSHHICVKNIAGKSPEKSRTFCQITNQSDWCSKQDSCHSDKDSMCDRSKWCVCEWAFDSFIEEKGCDAFEIDCDATNGLALDHYTREKKTEALRCLQEKCPPEA